MKAMKENYKDENGIEYLYKRDTAIACAYAKCTSGKKRVQGMNLFQSGKTTYESKAKLMEEFAKTYHVSMETVKKWLCPVGGSNPKSIQDIHDLEEFLEQPFGSFLTCVSKNKEMNSDMNNEIKSTEKECAKELYIALLETIDATFPSFRTFVTVIMHNENYCFVDSMADRRYEIMLKIRRTGMDLPKELRESAMKLVDRIFGPESEDPDAFFQTSEYGEFISSEDYQNYLKENWPDVRDIDVDKYNYCDHVRESCYAFLDEIFSMYLCR